MPYNLRKRKVPDPTPVPAKEEKPKKAKVERAAGTKKTATTKIVTENAHAEKREKSKVEDEPLKSPVQNEEVKDDQIASQKAKKAKVEPTSTLESQKPTVDHAGNQLVFGADTCGELGLKSIGFSKKRPTPTLIEEPIKQVVCGPMHTLSLTESGHVYSYGCNDEGALGRVTEGDEVLDSTPTLVELPSKIAKISTGDSHGAALSIKNEVFIWGNFRDEHGSVGLTPECDGVAIFKPLQIMPDTNFKDIASGSNHILLLDVDGVVYSFGVGAQGQLGRIKPEDLGNNENIVAIKADNRELYLRPQKVCLKNVDPRQPFICDAIYAGNFSSFATNTDKKKNRLAGWGLNNYYQLGYKGQKGQLVQHFPRRSTFTCSTTMINVACGQHHTLFLTKTGRVYAAGRNEYGMLGIGKEMQDKKEVCPAKQVCGFDTSVITVFAGINTSFAVDTDGKLYSWGMNGSNLGVDSGDNDLMEPTVVKSLADKKVTAVSSGSSFSAVIVN